jgi:DsbC/DsbD-like thiol-disulfide interchange protein
MRPFCLALLLFPTLLAAGPVKKEGVSLELVSEQAAIQPGKSFSVGIVFRPEPGFHIYWRQPGIVGMAPSLKWSLPAGFKAGEVLWPEPERVTMATWGAWGLKREGCLVVDITPPGNLDVATTREATIAVQAVWMCCSNTCHPGAADLSLKLPVTKDPPMPTSAAPLFAATRNEQPVEPAGWRFNARRSKDSIELKIEPPPGQSLPADAYFFNYQRLVDSHQPQRLRRGDGRDAVIEMKLTELPEEKADRLEGILHSATGFGSKGTPRNLHVCARLEP